MIFLRVRGRRSCAHCRKEGAADGTTVARSVDEPNAKKLKMSKMQMKSIVLLLKKDQVVHKFNNKLHL